MLPDTSVHRLYNPCTFVHHLTHQCIVYTIPVHLCITWHICASIVQYLYICASPDTSVHHLYITYTFVHHLTHLCTVCSSFAHVCTIGASLTFVHPLYITWPFSGFPVVRETHTVSAFLVAGLTWITSLATLSLNGVVHLTITMQTSTSRILLVLKDYDFLITFMYFVLLMIGKLNKFSWHELLACQWTPTEICSGCVHFLACQWSAIYISAICI